MYVLMLKRVVLQADGISSSTSGIAASSWMMAVRKKYTHFVWEDSNFFVSMPHSLLFVKSYTN